MAIMDLPYLRAAGDGGPRASTRVVVIHATANTASAHDEASYATWRTDMVSAHFYVDANEAYRSLPLDDIAFGCFDHGNRISVQIELCGRSDQISDATMVRAAPIVAEICQRYQLPIRKISASEVAAGVSGICGHVDITYAFPQDGGDHTDPGPNFPWTRFIGYVQNAANEGDDLMGVTIGGEPIEQYLPRIERALWWPVPVIARDVLGLKAAAASSATAIAGLRVAVDALAAAIANAGGSVDVGAIKATIETKTNEVKVLVEQRHAEEMAALAAERDAAISALQAELDALRASQAA